MHNILLAVYIIIGGAWSFFTGDWVLPSIFLFVVAPAWCFAGEKGKERLKEWQKSS